MTQEHLCVPCDKCGKLQTLPVASAVKGWHRANLFQTASLVRKYDSAVESMWLRFSNQLAFTLPVSKLCVVSRHSVLVTRLPPQSLHKQMQVCSLTASRRLSSTQTMHSIRLHGEDVRLLLLTRWRRLHVCLSANASSGIGGNTLKSFFHNSWSEVSKCRGCVIALRSYVHTDARCVPTLDLTKMTYRVYVLSVARRRGNFAYYLLDGASMIVVQNIWMRAHHRMKWHFISL